MRPVEKGGWSTRRARLHPAVAAGARAGWLIMAPVAGAARAGPGRAAPLAVAEATTGWELDWPACGRVEAEIARIEDNRERAERLAPHTRDPDPGVRARAAIAAGRIGDPAGTDLLLRLLEDPVASVRAAAAFALGELEGAPGSGAALRRHLMPLRESHAGVRALAAEALAKQGMGEEPELLVRVLDDPDPRVVQAALLSLWRVAPRGMARRALELTHSPDDAVRWKAAYALLRPCGASPSGRTPIPRSAQLPEDLRDLIRTRAVELSEDPAAVVRIQALGTMGELGGEGVLARLAARHADPDWRVRAEAARSLGRLRAPARELRRLVRDRVPCVRLAGLLALVAAPDADAAARIAEPFLRAPEEWAREGALATLAQIHWGLGRKGATARLLAGALGDPSWRVRAEAVRLAGELDPTGVLFGRLSAAADARWLETEDPRVLKFAVAPRLAQMARAGQRFRETLRRELARLLHHEDAILRASAVDALAGMLRDRERDDGRPEPWFREAHGILRRALEDRSADVRLAVVEAIAPMVPRERLAWNLLAQALRDPEYLVRLRAIEILRENGVALPDWARATVDGRSRRDPADGLRAARRARILTEKGTLVLELFAREAPLTVRNFARLARSGYYDGGRWHRVVPNFVVQDGCPRGDGWGGPGYAIRCEINTRRYGSGALGMALAGKDTGGSQFFITHSPQPHLDGGYTVFGRLRQGWEVLGRLAPGDRIWRVVVEQDPGQRRSGTRPMVTCNP